MQHTSQSFLVKPRGLPERLRFFLRRPDYGWQGLSGSKVLKITPEGGRVQRFADKPDFFRVEETVGGMKTALWLPEGVFDASPFQVEACAASSAWDREWREVVKDYVRYLWPNSPSVLLGAVWLLALCGFFYYSAKNPEGALEWLMQGDSLQITQVVAALCVIPILASFWVCHRRPARTRLANLLFQIEAWLLLLSLLATLPDLPGKIVKARQLANQLSSQTSDPF